MHAALVSGAQDSGGGEGFVISSRNGFLWAIEVGIPALSQNDDPNPTQPNPTQTPSDQRSFGRPGKLLVPDGQGSANHALKGFLTSAVGA